MPRKAKAPIFDLADAVAAADAVKKMLDHLTLLIPHMPPDKQRGAMHVLLKSVPAEIAGQIDDAQSVGFSVPRASAARPSSKTSARTTTNSRAIAVATSDDVPESVMSVNAAVRTVLSEAAADGRGPMTAREIAHHVARLRPDTTGPQVDRALHAMRATIVGTGERRARKYSLVTSRAEASEKHARRAVRADEQVEDDND